MAKEKTGASTRELILETAKTLLRRFGEDKMTVVDIARNLGMSHANVYRYFRSKNEIFDAIIDQWLSKIESFVDEIAARPGSAADRIEAVVLELHRKRRQKLKDDAAVFETYQRVMELRPDVVAKRRETIFNVFKKLIEFGIQRGEFKAIDPHQAATILRDATALFLHPLMIPTALNEDLEQRAHNVVACILSGFSSRPAKRRRCRTEFA
jgi:AcrR family transcriptional regulator